MKFSFGFLNAFSLEAILAMALGVDGGELTDMIGRIAGIITAAASAITYINAEAKVDAAAVKKQ